MERVFERFRKMDPMHREGNQALRSEARQLAEADLSAVRTIEELRRIAFFDIRTLFDDAGHLRPIDDLPADVRAGVAVYQVTRPGTRGSAAATRYRIKLWDKVRALE